MAKFMDVVGYFSYNPAGIFSSDNKGSISGAGNYSGDRKKDDSGATPPVATVAAPASFEDIKAAEEKKFLLEQQKRTKTILSAPLGNPDGGGTVQRKVLLGS